jgi:DNA-directed RNA polymerase subunit RPC12/RpoP
VEVRNLTEDEPQEYTCPECGSAFPEGSEKCPECGLVFDWSEETDYICPDCGATVHGEAGECPECGAQFVHEHTAERGYAEERTIDAMLDAAVAETLVTPIRDELDLAAGETAEAPVEESEDASLATQAPEAEEPSEPAGEGAGTAAEGEAGEEYEQIGGPAWAEEGAPGAPPPKMRSTPAPPRWCCRASRSS